MQFMKDRIESCFYNILTVKFVRMINGSESLHFLLSRGFQEQESFQIRNGTMFRFGFFLCDRIFVNNVCCSANIAVLLGSSSLVIIMFGNLSSQQIIRGVWMMMMMTRRRMIKRIGGLTECSTNWPYRYEPYQQYNRNNFSIMNNCFIHYFFFSVCGNLFQ